MRGATWALAAVIGLMGCSGRKSSLLLERQARGPLAEEGRVATAMTLHLKPASQTQTKQSIEVELTLAAAGYLKEFFANKEIFGPYAGKSPYFPEHLVFYVKIANQTRNKIRINPAEFVMVDDRGNQYSTIGTDYVTAFADYKHGTSTATRGVLADARPGYFGFSLPVGQMVASKPQGQFALLQQSALQSGYLYPGVVHDGLIAFWNPAAATQRLLVIVANIKTAFDANDLPTTAVDFTFEFDTTKP